MHLTCRHTLFRNINCLEKEGSTILISRGMSVFDALGCLTNARSPLLPEQTNICEFFIYTTHMHIVVSNWNKQQKRPSNWNSFLPEDSLNEQITNLTSPQEVEIWIKSESKGDDLEPGKDSSEILIGYVFFSPLLNFGYAIEGLSTKFDNQFQHI